MMMMISFFRISYRDDTHTHGLISKLDDTYTTHGCGQEFVRVVAVYRARGRARERRAEQGAYLIQTGVIRAGPEAIFFRCRAAK